MMIIMITITIIIIIIAITIIAITIIIIKRGTWSRWSRRASIIRAPSL